MGSKITCPTINIGDFINNQPIYATLVLKGLIYEKDDTLSLKKKTSYTKDFYTKKRQIVIEIMELYRIFEIEAVSELNDLQDKDFTFQIDFNHENFIKFISLYNNNPLIKIYYHNFDVFFMKSIFLAFNMTSIGCPSQEKSVSAEFDTEKEEKNLGFKYVFYGDFYYDILQCKMNIDKNTQFLIVKEILKYTGSSFSKDSDKILSSDHGNWFKKILDNQGLVVNKLLDYSFENPEFLNEIERFVIQLSHYGDKYISESSLIPDSIEKILDIIEKKVDKSKVYIYILNVLCHYDKESCSNKRLKSVLLRKNDKKINIVDLVQEFTNSDMILFEFLTKKLNKKRLDLLFRILKTDKKALNFLRINSEKVCELYKDLNKYFEIHKFENDYQQTFAHIMYINKYLIYPDFSHINIKGGALFDMNYKKVDFTWPDLFHIEINKYVNPLLSNSMSEFLFTLNINEEKSWFPTNFFIFDINSYWKKIMIFTCEVDFSINEFENFKNLNYEQFEKNEYPMNLKITLQVFYDSSDKKSVIIAKSQLVKYSSFEFKTIGKKTQKLLVYYELKEKHFSYVMGVLGVDNEENLKYDFNKLNVAPLERIGV